jgi:transcriptional regulator with XRE-family HTH domain
MTSLGERIRQRRTEMNIALAELARRADLSKGYLHAIETGGTQSPSAEILFRIANELGTTIADLLGEEETEQDGVDFPPELIAFAEQADLTQEDVEMLAGIRYRGKRPETVDDWRYIFEFIRRTLR